VPPRGLRAKPLKCCCQAAWKITSPGQEKSQRRVCHVRVLQAGRRPATNRRTLSAICTIAVSLSRRNGNVGRRAPAHGRRRSNQVQAGRRGVHRRQRRRICQNGTNSARVYADARMAEASVVHAVGGSVRKELRYWHAGSRERTSVGCSPRAVREYVVAYVRGEPVWPLSLSLSLSSSPSSFSAKVRSAVRVRGAQRARPLGHHHHIVDLSRQTRRRLTGRPDDEIATMVMVGIIRHMAHARDGIVVDLSIAPAQPIIFAAHTNG